MNTKLVSVIIPVYNVEKFVKQAIVSMMHQTYKNLEIIVIDDGSSDSTAKIVEELAVHDSRIRLYKNEQNLKIVKTLNRALSLAQGDYIARMDGDDISALDRIEKQVDFLKSNLDYGLVGCSIIVISSNGEELWRATQIADYDLLVKLNMQIVHPAWLVRKSIYTKLNGYREISGAEDLDFLLRMISEELKFTNIESYFGLFYRTNRDGNSVSSLGLRQIKMANYCRKLFAERQKTGTDSFSEADLQQAIITSRWSEKIYSLSNKYFLKGSAHRNNHHYIRMIFYYIISLVSIEMVFHYYRRIKIRLIKIRYKSV